MNIHSFTRLLSLPLILAVGYYLYLMFTHTGDNTEYVVVPVLLLAVLYVSQPHIDFWWHKKFPPVLDEKMKLWLTQYLPYYVDYSTDQRAEFDKRLKLYTSVREFKSVGEKELKEVPYDIQCILSSQAIRLCLGLNDYLIKDLDRVYCYKHPFPSPRYQVLHTVESEIGDGIIIFSLEQGLPGITNPDVYYNIVLHGYAEAFILLYTNIQWPSTQEDDWAKLGDVNPIFDKNVVHSTVGFEYIDLLIVHIVAFFEFPLAYKNSFAEEYSIFAKIFNQDFLH
jgi:hypothetical protein